MTVIEVPTGKNLFLSFHLFRLLFDQSVAFAMKFVHFSIHSIHILLLNKSMKRVDWRSSTSSAICRLLLQNGGQVSIQKWTISSTFVSDDWSISCAFECGFDYWLMVLQRQLPPPPTVCLRPGSARWACHCKYLFVSHHLFDSLFLYLSLYLFLYLSLYIYIYIYIYLSLSFPVSVSRVCY